MRLVAFRLAVLAALFLPAGASAQIALPVTPGQDPPPAEAFRFNDFAEGNFRDVLPPGTEGVANGAELGAFLGTGARPEHNADQLQMYEDLVREAPDLSADELRSFFKEASFGVRPGDVESTESPRSDVTVVRDKAFGVPHVYGRTRDGAMFGLGYVAADDRLFLMDVLRNVGRARLSAFAGGAKGNRDFDAEQWSVAPYTEDDLQRQVDQLDDLYGNDGVQVQRDIEQYVAGVNSYIDAARLDPTKLPGEYAAFGRLQGPDRWKATDVIATAALVGGIFGKGGGTELQDAVLLQTFRARLGRKRGTRLWRQLGAFEDPEAPTTVARKRFVYGAPPRKPRGLAMPDRGSVSKDPVVVARSGSAAEGASASSQPPVLDLAALPNAMSNAVLLSRRETTTGRPLAVFGPQTGYFSPNLLMEQDVHAPASSVGPGIDARGSAFAGTNLYVQLGRGRDYAWSATSAGQDITDTYALALCDPAGGTPTKESNSYEFGGECRPMEELRRENCFEPNAADQTPAGCETLLVRRTALGLVTARGTIDGKPVAYAKLRRTYFHEVDSVFGFRDFNDPAKMRNARDFQRAANRIQYTFNWFYVDDRDIAYFNGGANPVRPRGVDQNLPTQGRAPFLWRGFDPGRNLSDVTPFAQHPQAINQPILSSWNNKQARGFRGAGFGAYQSVHRVDLLNRRAKRLTRGPRKMSLAQLAGQVEDGGSGDLRGQEVLPWALRVIGKRRIADPAARAAVAELRAWVRSGAHRRDSDQNGEYEFTEAIKLMDAWWPRMLEGMFKPRLGSKTFTAMKDRLDFDDHNRDDHVGSAFQNGWYGYAQRDLRTVLGQKVRGRYAVRFCGRGSRARCRSILLRTLTAASAVDPAELYADPLCPADELPNLQMCSEAIRFTPGGGVTQPLIHWINRPTYQMVADFPGHRPR